MSLSTPLLGSFQRAMDLEPSRSEPDCRSPLVIAGHVEGASSQCPNCLEELASDYCAQCGQRRIDVEELSARHFFNELADELTHFRTKFKAVHTLGRLVVPGLLTADFLAGRRQRHLSPFKTYLVCAAIFFLSAPVAGFRLAAMLDADRSGVLRTLVSARSATLGLDPAVFNLRFDAHVQSAYTVTLGAVAFIIALTLQVMFLKRRWPFGAHLVFALHYISFIYLLTIIAGVSRRIGLSIDVAAVGGYAVILPYVIMSVRRVYAGTTAAIVWKGTALLLITIVLNDLANFVAIRLTLMIA